MLLLSVLVVFLVALLKLPSAESYNCDANERKPWSYNGVTNGPSQWGAKYPICNGRSQSPIDITTATTVLLPEQTPLMSDALFTAFLTPLTRARVENNGHLLRIIPQDNIVRSIPLNGEMFVLTEVHWHWGRSSNWGSEHTIDGQHFASELHYIFQGQRSNTWAAVAVLIQDEPQDNPAFVPVDELLPYVRFQDNYVQLRQPLELAAFLPTDGIGIYKYSGSMTAPPCLENVTFVVLDGTNYLGTSQLSRLRQLSAVSQADAHINCEMVDNFRPTQPLNGRIVYSSFL